MPADITSYHINTALANLSLQTVNPEVAYANEMACGVVPVEKVAGKYFIYGRELGASKSAAGGAARNIRSLRAAGSQAAEVDYSLSANTYTCSEYSPSDLATDEEITDADAPLPPILAAAQNVRQWVMNDVENVWVKIAADLTQYNASNKTTLVTGTTSWANNSATSDPLGNIKTARKRIELILQRPANTIVLSAETARVLAEHTQLKDIFKYTESGFTLLGGNGLPPELRGLRVVVASAVANTAAEGATYSGGYIAQDSAGNDFALICYVPPGKTIGKRGVSSFIKLDAPDQTTNQRGVSVRSF